MTCSHPFTGSTADAPHSTGGAELVVSVRRTVDVHVRRLRVKVGLDVPLAATLRGVGYRLGGDVTAVVVPEVAPPPPNS